MAEIKNTFLKSKMNKDLDERLLPNGEYRDAQNIAISKSEDSNVGAAENVQGNQLVLNGDVGKIVSATLLSPDPLVIIGQFADEINSRIYLFLTTNFVENLQYKNHHFIVITGIDFFRNLFQELFIFYSLLLDARMLYPKNSPKR